MLVNTKDIRTDGSLGGREIKMSLDANSLVHLMSVLSDMYSDPAGAVIREYTTNALDSHLAAGQSRPVELGTPSRLSPYFTVQDFGVGMSEDDIENIYSQFGNSTKRGNNLEAGMLGLGSKSALTFTEQFNLITVKDGTRLLVSISRSSDGSGSIEIVDSRPTDEPNGVLIKVPVQVDMDEFNDKVHEFAKYVTKGMIIVNGQEPDSDLEYVTSDLAIVPRGSYSNSEDRVVMGNVSYPTGNQLIGTHQVIYFIGMGEVDFTPAREELMDTSITRATLRKMEAEFETYFKGHLERQIEECETSREAFELSEKYRRDFRSRNLSFFYRGTALPTMVAAQVAAWSTNIDTGRTSYGPVQFNGLYSNGINDKMLIVTGWKNNKFTKVQARKLKEYLTKIGRGTEYQVILQEYKPFPELFRENTVVSWDEVRKMTVPAKAKVARTAKTWELIGGAQPKKSFTWCVPDAKLDIYYGSKSLVEGSSVFMNVVDDDTQFVYVTPSQEDRFKKLYPKAKFIADYYHKFVTDYLMGMTKEDFEFFDYFYTGNRNDYLLDWTKIDDPELSKILRYTGSGYAEGPEETRYKRARDAANQLPWREREKYKFPEFSPRGKHDKVYAKYPLIDGATFYSSSENAALMIEHLHEYANRIYNNEQEKVKDGE